MSLVRRFGLAAAVFSLILGSFPAAAYFNHFLHGTILGTLSRAEADAFASSFRAALTGTPDGGTVPFQFPADKRHGAITGNLTVLASKVDRGESCRQVRSEVNRGS